jgi:branched-chain amino acid transport system substrate-binding protein
MSRSNYKKLLPPPSYRHSAAFILCIVALGLGVWLLTKHLEAKQQASMVARPIVIGALYPLSQQGGTAPREEYAGLRIAADMVNAAGGVHGRPVHITVVNVPRRDDAPAAVFRLAHEHVTAIVGSSESLIAVPASEAAQAAGVIYWESGAVATMLTEPGHPNVFRTVTTAQTLGRSAADFAARVIAPRLHIPVHQLRVAVVSVHDVYGSSVAAAQIAEVRQLHMHLVRAISYYAINPETPTRFARVVRMLKAAHPNVVLVAAYLQDAIAFRRETLAQHLHVGAMIGTSSSFCMPEFGRILGRGALGLFASDKPDVHINPRALLPSARRLSHQADARYHQRFGSDMTAPAVAGFVAGWILLHDVLPHAHTLSPAGIRQAALAVNLPYGSEINGAGVKFAGPGEPDEGQNLRATSVVWQWQQPNRAVVVYPPLYATAKPRWIPLPW